MTIIIPKKYVTRHPLRCTIEGCESQFYAKNLCKKHYGRFIRRGNPQELYDPRGRIMAESLRQAFERYFKRGNEKECWPWLGSVSHTGYGELRYKSKTYRAHRVSYMLHISSFDDELFICHKCDNPPCVNPNHLFAGTANDNVQDKVNKNRQAQLQEHGRAVLNNQQAKEIKDLLAKGYARSQLAKMYHVSKSIIIDIDRGFTWKNI